MKIEMKKEIDSLTRALITNGVVVDQQYPIVKNDEVTWSGCNDISICLKNIDYREIYLELNKSKAYNFKFLDGAIIQMQYKFNKKNEIIQHRLAYFPSPILERYENNLDCYNPVCFEDDIYSDILDRHIVTTPIRIDYTPDQFIEDEHPVCHIHFGQIENCRIPVKRAITPNEFMKFILRHFYNNIYQESFTKYKFNSPKIKDNSITSLEESNIHISIV